MKVVLTITCLWLLAMCSAELCIQGTTYERDCNRCTCTRTGMYVCTDVCLNVQHYPDNIPTQPIDSPRFPREIQPRRGKYDPPKEKQLDILRFEMNRCEPNKIKKLDCNHCKCTKQGIGFLCTTKVCPKAVEAPEFSQD